MADLAIAVLAAGSSRRFGAADKLTAPLAGKMLGLHATATLAGLAARHRWVIAPRGDHLCVAMWQAQGFAVIVNAHAATGLGSSVALAAQQANDAGAGALLIALADMPCVTAHHFRAVIAAGANAGSEALVASTGEAGFRGPPALFGAERFAALMSVSGDAGARTLLPGADLIAAPDDSLLDVDVTADLDRAALILGAPPPG